MTQFYWPTGYVSHHLDSVLSSQVHLHRQDGGQNNLWEKNNGRDIFCTERPVWKTTIYVQYSTSKCQINQSAHVHAWKYTNTHVSLSSDTASFSDPGPTVRARNHLPRTVEIMAWSQGEKVQWRPIWCVQFDGVWLIFCTNFSVYVLPCKCSSSLPTFSGVVSIIWYLCLL